LALPPGLTYGDLVKITKSVFKPIPPPKRPKTNPREQMLATRGFQAALQDVNPVLAQLIERSDFHPRDLTQIVSNYETAKTVKIKPEELDARIKEAQEKGLYVEEPSRVVPPKSGKSKSGAIKSWDALDEEEQAEAYAEHRNQVLAASFALRSQVQNTYESMGLPSNVASTLAAARLSRRPGESHKDRAARSAEVAQRSFESTLESNAPPKEYSDDDLKKALKVAGDDPLAKNLVVAHFQANDYLKAREKYLTTKGPDQLDERDSPRHLAARLRDVSDELRRSDKKYPAETRFQNTADTFRKRFFFGLHAKWPDRAAKIEPEIQKMDADDWDNRKAEYDEQTEDFKKASAKYQKAQKKAQAAYEADLKKTKAEPGGHPYRSVPVVKSVKQRLEEAGVEEPLPPQDLPPKPLGYDKVRKSPSGLAQMGKKLWNRLRHGLSSKSKTASERIVERYLAFSTCEPGLAMGTPANRNASVSKTGLYWGVDQPSKEKSVNVPYIPWSQAHARDLTEKDYGGILAAAREWMKVPVLARILDEKDSLGAVRDIQIRAALDLALRDHEEGKYAVGLHPTVYNDLLARLAGKPSASPLLTQREASRSLYTPATGEDRLMNAASKIRKMAADLANQNPAVAFDLMTLAAEIPENFKKKDDEGQGQEQDKQASKYAALRTAIIRTAAQNPAVRPALMPVLQMIKQQG
jgi:hypothetical protein